MFLFRFESPRHATYKRRTYSQSLTRGDFKLRVLNKAVGDNYKIIPCGHHPVFGLLKSLHLQDMFYGHFISVPDFQQATLLRLMVEELTNPGVVFHGIYREPDLETIKDKVTSIQTLSNQLSYVNQYTSSLKYSINYTTPLLRYTDGTLPCTEPIMEKTMGIKTHIDEMTKLVQVMNEKSIQLTNQKHEEVKELQQYFDDLKTS